MNFFSCSALISLSLAVCLLPSIMALALKIPSQNLELPRENELDDSCPPGTAFYNETMDCYTLEGESPCGKSMIFIEDSENASFGTCACKYGRESDCAGKPVGYWKASNQCYHLFEQGPCKSGEWLVSVEDTELECQTSACNITQAKDVSLPSPVFTFTLNGTCYSTNEQAFCEKDEIAIFLGNNYNPTCVSATEKKPYCYGSELKISKLLGPNE